MADSEPLRPRARREYRPDTFIPRVAVDIVDLRGLETELLAVGPLEITSDQFDGKATTIDAFTVHEMKSLENLEMEAIAEGNFLPAIGVSFDRKGANVHVLSESDHRVAGVRLRAEQICRSRVRQSGVWGARLTIPLFALTPLALGVPFLSLALLQRDETATYSLWWLLLPVFVALAALVAGALAYFVRGQILLVPRAEMPSWFARNRDGLTVQVLGGAVVLLLGFALGRLT